VSGRNLESNKQNYSSYVLLSYTQELCYKKLQYFLHSFMIIITSFFVIKPAKLYFLSYGMY